MVDCLRWFVFSGGRLAILGLSVDGASWVGEGEGDGEGAMATVLKSVRARRGECDWMLESVRWLGMIQV